MNLSTLITTCLRIHKMCHYLYPGSQPNTFFYNDILRIIGVKQDIFTNKCVFVVNNFYPPPVCKSLVSSILISLGDAEDGGK